MSCSSPSSASSTSSTSPPLRGATSVASLHSPTATSAIQPVIVPPPPMMLVRRMTPQEDLLATLMGIDVLVRQRQQLIEGLVGRHNQMARKNEVAKLEQFSKEIDAIMKMRNPTVSTPDTRRRRKRTPDASAGGGPGAGSPSSRGPLLPDAADAADFSSWEAFRPRSMEADDGIRSLQRMLNINPNATNEKKKGEK